VRTRATEPDLRILPHRTFNFSATFAGILAATLLSALSGCAVPQPHGFGSLRRVVEPTTKRGYWLYLPKGYVNRSASERHERRWPLVVTFHGMKPFDNARPQAREWEQEADRYGFVVVAPQLKAPDVLGQFPVRKISERFKSDERATLAILDHVFATTDADPGAVLSTSWSSGGYMAHYMLNHHPSRFTCLAVRQSNFSASVLDPGMTERSRNHPLLILNTQNDFAICKRESKEAIHWYEQHDYHKLAWVIIKHGGHVRTPDLAAGFFAGIVGVHPNTPPAVLAGRQAIDGNRGGLALLAAGRAEMHPAQRVAAKEPVRRKSSRRAARPPTPRRATVASAVPAQANTLSARRLDLSRTTPQRISAVASRRPPLPAPLKIRVSSAIGIEPLRLGFTAECPTAWQDRADFLWTLDDKPIGNGLNGQKTITTSGEHTLAVLVVTEDGREHRAARAIRVLPRFEPAHVGDD